jgi:hypothetical protein
MWKTVPSTIHEEAGKAMTSPGAIQFVLVRVVDLT